MGRYRLVLVITVLQLFLTVSNMVAALTIQVCQNKDCCKRYKTQSMNLVHTIYNLLPPSSDIHVEATGCLSQCQKGPNIAIIKDNSQEEPTIYNDISDHFCAAAVLPIDPPPTLLTAVSVMEKAEKGTYKSLASVVCFVCLFIQAVTIRVAGRKHYMAISYPVLCAANNDVKGTRRVDFV
jgi:hypothetical protein